MIAIVQALHAICVFAVAGEVGASSAVGAKAASAAPPSELQAGLLARAEGFINCSAGYSNDHGDITRVAIKRNPTAPKPVIQNDYNGSLQSMARRSDCSDFGVPNIIRVLYSTGAESLDSDPIKREQLKQGILGWQYWIDQIEGTKPDNHFEGGMEVWTENHQMDFHVSEYLAGMLFPDEMFWGTNMTGKQHADTGRTFVTRWLERRYRWGFSEWRSATYYQFCFHSVTTLASLAPEPIVATRAGIVLDLMLLDVSMHSLHGMLASSQGRSYGDSKWSWHGQGTATLSWMLTGDGLGPASSDACREDPHGSHCNANCDDGTALAVALAATAAPGLPNSHLVSDVILGIAKDVNTRTFVARERIGIGPEEPELAAQTNLTLDTDPARANTDAYVWMGMGNYAHPRVLPMIVSSGNNLGLFRPDSNETTFLGAWAQFANMSAASITDYASKNSDGMTYYGTLGPAETYLWRSPHVALSSLTNFVDKGAVGDQQHAWQATLNGSAVVFTTHPGPDLDPSSPSGTSDYSDGYWTGSASLPRIGQHENAALILYRPPPQIYTNAALRKQLFPFAYTHAGFDHTQFDELVDELATARRIAGRVGMGYVALFSASEVAWANDTNTHYNCSGGSHCSSNIGREIVASTDSHGRSVWACVVGDTNTHGSFANFTDTVLKTSTLSYSTDDAMTTTLLLGASATLTMAWDGPMTMTKAATDIAEVGKEQHNKPAPVDVPLASHLRYDNPYAEDLEPTVVEQGQELHLRRGKGVKFPLTGGVRFAFGAQALELDFDKGTRVTVDVKF